jgi:hypothetical protein
MDREIWSRGGYAIHKVGPVAQKQLCAWTIQSSSIGEWARFAHRRVNVAPELKGLRAAMVVANVGALLLCAEDAITRSPALNLLPWTGSYC